MIASQIFDHDARVRSFEITMEVWSSRKTGEERAKA